MLATRGGHAMVPLEPREQRVIVGVGGRREARGWPPLGADATTPEVRYARLGQQVFGCSV
jgi:hypothetical protein